MKYRIVNPDLTGLSARTDLHPLSLKVLSNAALSEAQFDNLFFSGEHFPSCSNLTRIAARIRKALSNHEKVFVFGDYDADGVCSTTLMVRFLKRLGIECGYYIPNRLTEGYGLSAEKADMALSKGYTLIVTVDNGVAAKEALDLLAEKKTDVIVTDHHNIPDGAAFEYLLHPDVFDDEYYRSMCGAGVVLQLIRHFGMDDHTDWILAMTATIGDMMPLFFANREIVKRGLASLNREGFKPIEYLSRKDSYDETAISFDVVPAINTLGRLADRANTNNLVRYFLSEDEMAIVRMADQIVSLNRERQQLVRDARKTEADAVYETPNYDVYVSSKYHEGIAGLLANAIMTETHRATLVLVEAEDGYRGSGRSMPSFNIFESLQAYEELFSTFGGHDQACGLSLSKERLPELIGRMNLEEKTAVTEESTPVIALCEEDLSMEAVEELLSLRPFGEGFKLPDFYIPFLPVNYVQTIKGIYKKGVSHLSGETVESICFRPEITSCLSEKGWSEVIFSLSVNEFRGRKSVSLNIRDRYEQ